MNNEQQKSVHMSVEVPIQRFIDTLCSATYSSSYWCSEMDLPRLEGRPEVVGWDGRGWTAFFEGPDDGTITITDGQEQTEHVVTLAQAMQRIQDVFTKTRHMTDLLNENDDGDTADVLLQCIVLGEVVYG